MSCKVMHGSDRRLNRGELSIFDRNYTAFEQNGAPNKQMLRGQIHRQYITYAMATKNHDIRKTVNRQISISGYIYVQVLIQGP